MTIDYCAVTSPYLYILYTALHIVGVVCVYARWRENGLLVIASQKGTTIVIPLPNADRLSFSFFLQLFDSIFAQKNILKNSTIRRIMT